MDTHYRQRSSLLKRIASLLIFLLATTWTVSFFYFIQLHRLQVDGNLGQLESLTLSAKGEDATVNNRGPENKRDNPSSDVHIVFSTDCSGYQHWQSIASYYSFRRAGHLGPITRIVSGCDPSQEEKIRTEFRKIQQGSSSTSNNPQLRVHFTPSFALGGKNYKYSNKPGGLYHWMRNHTTTLEESVVALVDPDMMALRPIVPGLGEGMTLTSVSREGHYRDLLEYKDENGKVLLMRQKKLPPLPARVTKGVAAGQHFGLGGFWASSGMKNARPSFRHFNLTAVCGVDSPCSNVPPSKGSDRAYTTREFADKNYAVGPVYIASAQDWMDLLPRWHDFMPRVHEQYPQLLAEMYAFTMAAADMQLKFALSSSYMVSDPSTMSSTEAWVWIDEYATRVTPQDDQSKQHTNGKTLRSVCDGATSNSLPTKTLHLLENYGYGKYHDNSDVLSFAGVSNPGALPTVLHYCQNYNLADHKFAKRKMHHEFFRCNGEPLKFDVEILMKELDTIEKDGGLSENSKKSRMRTGFMLCHLIPLMNMALADYKLDVCGKQ